MSNESWEIVAPEHTSGWGLCIAEGRDIVVRLPGRDQKAKLEIARRIVRAVNCFDELLAACKEALAEMEECIDVNDEPEDPPAGSIMDRIRAAIEKAEGRL
jgi:hypothetical protein